MRDLNSINPIISNKSDLCLLMLSTCLIFNGFSLWIINAATPQGYSESNWLFKITLVILVFTAFLSGLSWIKKWNYRAKSLAMTLYFCLHIILLFYVIPISCMLVFGSMDTSYKLELLILSIAIPSWWIKRHVNFFKRIYQYPELFQALYFEEHDAIYYIEKYHIWLMRKKFKFDKYPPKSLFLLSFLGAGVSLYFNQSITDFLGIPIGILIVLIIGLPISFASIGLLTQDIHTCWYFPNLIKKNTSKNVYIDVFAGLSHISKKKNRL